MYEGILIGAASMYFFLLGMDGIKTGIAHFKRHRRRRSEVLVSASRMKRVVHLSMSKHNDEADVDRILGTRR